MMSVELKAGEKLVPGIPKALFQTNMLYGDLTGNRNYYVPSVDGRKFLISSAVQEKSQTSVVVRLNWIRAMRDRDARAR